MYEVDEGEYSQHIRNTEDVKIIVRNYLGTLTGEHEERYVAFNIDVQKLLNTLLIVEKSGFLWWEEYKVRFEQMSSPILTLRNGRILVQWWAC